MAISANAQGQWFFTEGAAASALKGAAYNLAGQKVGNDFKGVVVKDGKKMIQK